MDILRRATIPLFAIILFAFLLPHSPFWQIWWFRLFIGMLVLGIVAAICGARIKYLLGLKRKEFESSMKIEKMRTDIAADFHDGIGSGLGSLGLEIDLLAGREDVPEHIRVELHKFRNRLDEIAEFRREMTWMINNENDSLVHLTDRIQQAAYEIVPADYLSVEIHPDMPDLLVNMEVRKHLLLLMKEALFNAVRHARANEIRVLIRKNDNAYTFMVSDNGTGFDLESVVRGEGLDNMQSRALSIDADFDIHSSSADGTAVIVTIRMDDSHHYANGNIVVD